MGLVIGTRIYNYYIGYETTNGQKTILDYYASIVIVVEHTTVVTVRTLSQKQSTRGMYMRRPRRESSAVRHGTPAPMMVLEQDPIADHPGLGRLTRKRIERIAKRTGGKGKAHVKVNVQVEAKAGKGGE